MKFRKFSQNISWPVDMNMEMSELMMSSPHYLPYILYIKFEYFHILPKLVIVYPSYQAILELTLYYIYSERNWGKSHVLIAEIWNFCHFCVQNEWEIVRRWHHQFAHLHIHIDWSRNVSLKFAKLQSVITSLFFNRFSSGFHCFVFKKIILSSELKLNLFRSSPLSWQFCRFLQCYSRK